MRGKKESYRLAVFTILLIVVVSSINSSDTGEFHFKWALIMPGQRGEVRSFDQDFHILQIKPEQQFGFYIKPGNHSFIYLYFFSPLEGISPLFPGSFSDFKKKVYYENYYRLPASSELWYTCQDPVKGDRIYLFASPVRQKKLEKLTEKYLANENAGDLKVLLDEMEKLLSASVTADKNFSSIESIAGVEKDGDKINIRSIESKGLYAEIITFEVQE